MKVSHAFRFFFFFFFVDILLISFPLLYKEGNQYSNSLTLLLPDPALLETHKSADFQILKGDEGEGERGNKGEVNTQGCSSLQGYKRYKSIFLAIIKVI